MVFSKNRIVKIGGKLLSEPSGFQNIIDLISNLKSEEKAILVFSAAGKSTRNLSDATNSAIKDIDYSIEILQNLKDYYFSLIENLNIEDEDLNKKIDAIFARLIGYIRAMHVTAEVSDKHKDYVIAHGEILTGLIIQKLLSFHKFDYAFIDSFDFLVTDSNFGNANPRVEVSAANFNKIFEKTRANIIITQGFIASDSDRNLTTMGFESSNLTVILLAKFIGAKEVEIITDVPGILSFDPELVFSEKVDGLTYQEAIKLADSGLKLLYPGMIRFSMDNDIRIRIGNYSQKSFTEISEKKGKLKPIVISNFPDNSLISIIFCRYSKMLRIIEIIENDIEHFNYSKIEEKLEIEFESTIDKAKLIQYLIAFREILEI